MTYTLQNRKMPSPRSAMIYLITAFVLALLGGLFPIANAFSMLAVCFASVALLSFPRMTFPRILLILTGASIVIAATVYLLTRNVAFCFAAASFAPATALLTLTIRKRYSRSCGIILGALGMGLFYLAFYALAIYFSYHRFSLDLFKELYASMEEQTRLAFAEYMNSEAAAQLSVKIDEDVMVESLKLTLSLLPAIFTVLMLGTVWLSTVLLRLIFKGYVYGAARFADWKVTMNRPAAVIFCLATLLFVLPFPESLSFIPTVCLNLLLILLPGFFCVGCSIWKARLFRNGRGLPFPMVLLLFLLALFVSLFFIVYFVALSGVMQHLFPKFRQKKPIDHP